eukprot:m.166228 g.166228  ORF g.166228 m.166228 type:complete len:109 (-) comp21099_c3_seq2:104-430(-)
MKDFSFHQHGPQLYSGWGYGAIFTANLLAQHIYAQGTQYTMSSAQWELFVNFIVQGQQMATRGPNFDFAASGRLMTYFNTSNRFGVNEGHYHYFACVSFFFSFSISVE